MMEMAIFLLKAICNVQMTGSGKNTTRRSRTRSIVARARYMVFKSPHIPPSLAKDRSQFIPTGLQMNALTKVNAVPAKAQMPKTSQVTFTNIGWRKILV